MPSSALGSCPVFLGCGGFHLGGWGGGEQGPACPGAMMCHSPSRGGSVCCLSPQWCPCGVVVVMFPGAAGGQGSTTAPCPLVPLG